jgi:BirA family biotin operon repressor/biotin-[acetyl-CoA-carboxylase] ligase
MPDQPVQSRADAAHVFPLLRLLADGRWHARGALAQALGIAAVTLSRRLSLLASAGLSLERDRARGVRLSRPIRWLEPGLLARLPAGAGNDWRVEVVDACESTNAALMARARAGEHGPLALACEWQTAGRGRRGRAWSSGIGCSLTFSVLWRIERGAAGLAGLSLAMGVLVADALAQLGVPGVRLKWPNDLYAVDAQGTAAKLGGILVESAGSGGRAGDGAGALEIAVVAGIGLNLALPPQARAAGAALDTPVASLEQLVPVLPAPSELLAALLRALGPGLAQFGREGFAPFRERWCALDLWRGSQVCLRDADRVVLEGESQGVDSDGALLVRTAGGMQRCLSGELSLRLARAEAA